MKKIIIVNASPRQGGNSDVIEAKLAAELKGAEVEVFKLREKTVNPCHACDACKAKDVAGCVQKDDMGALIAKLDTCDGLVLISPIYFNDINGPAKTFIDRMYCFFNPGKPGASVAARRDKKVAVICPCGAGPADVYTERAKMAAGCFGSGGFSEIKAYVCGDVNPAGACAKNPEQMAEISKIAQWLA